MSSIAMSRTRGQSSERHPPAGEFDALAIGSGMGGLAAAALLDKHGRKRCWPWNATRRPGDSNGTGSSGAAQQPRRATWPTEKVNVGNNVPHYNSLDVGGLSVGERWKSPIAAWTVSP
jgi:cation diffusion facilitator CzcD-associated flavoprotein CzcO